MSETLKIWFRTRLGVIIDLSPEIFGHYARDGTLLAKLLHSYDIITDSQLSTIIKTHDPALSRVNLKHLKVWLRFIGVDYDNQTINEISNGKGCTSLRLFYKIYLALENKDRLHFITLQKEREKFIPTSTKFDVTKISEEPPPSEPFEDSLAAPLAEKLETIVWYRDKCQDIIDACKREREKFKEVQKLKSKNSVDDDPVLKAKLVGIKQNEIKDIDDFERKQKTNASYYKIYEGTKKKRSRKDLKTSVTMLETMEEYLKKMKKRRDHETTTKNFKERMQKLLLSEIWEKLLQDQENEFDEIIAKKVLMQSQYEKRIVTNLCEIRRHKNKIAENRQIVENLMQKTRENEILLDYERAQEIQRRDKDEIEDEYERLCELERRLFDEKIRKIKEKHEKTCSDIVSDLIDMSIKAAECLRENDNCIPRSVWNEWRALFIKNQPIFESVTDLGEENGGEEEEEIEEVSRLESERQDALNNFDFETYHNIESPWDEYLPDLDSKTKEILQLGLVVLGYIVHKLLAFLYPYPPDPVPIPIPEVEKRVIVLGIPNRILVTLQHLLDQSGIKLIFMEDAINHCLRAYKEEMKDDEYISLTPLISEEKIEKVEQADKPKKDSAKKVTKQTKPEKSSKTKNVRVESKALHKQVQTPRNIPYEDMDPTLSDDAYIGKWTYELLTLGQPISKELNTKILIQYLRSLTNIRGWAIVDYPNNYEQMASLESALTGLKLPRISLDANTEGSISAPTRTSFEDEASDTFSVYRNSQLVPNPILRTNSDSKTFMTGFIRVISKPKEFDEDIFEVLPEDATPMDTFYANQSVAYVLYYSAFDVPTLKRLARLIIGDMAMPRKPSAELFGEVIKDLQQKQTTIPSVVKQLIPKASDTFSQFSIYEEERKVTPEKIDLPKVINPGEEAWVWVNFSQPDDVLEAIAILWENLESVYITNLKDIFCVKRLHANAIVPYKIFIVKHMEEFISRPDIKQEVFKHFYREFNTFDQDMRTDSDLKCELQCRVADVQSELFEICDQRKKESEEERQRMIQDHWTAMEAIALINVYINIAQVEIDRSIDTIQMLQDYYNSMMQKPLGNRLPKVLLARLDTPVDKHVQKLSKESKKKKSLKIKKSKGEFSWEPPAAVDCELIKEEIADLLLDVEKEDFDFNSVCYRAIKINLDYVEGIVNSLASSFNDMFKKEETGPKKKGKPKKSRKPSTELVSGDNLEKYRYLIQEWNYATMFEINRMKMRMQMLDNAVRSDISFLIDTMRGVFHLLYKSLVDRSEREVNSVTEMANIFCLAIEEERAIKEEMFFDGDRFVIKKIYVEEPLLITEEVLPFRFQMAQLGRLMDTLRHAAPQGNISRRAFFYILMDIITLGEEQDEVLVPSAWYKLQNEQVCQIIQELFGCECDPIEWREFILYGMEIPIPSVEQLLDARNTFEAFDPQLKEMITREQFHSVPIWFYKSTEIDPNCTYVLHNRNVSEQNLGEEASCYNFERINGIRLPSKMFKRQKKFSCEEDEESSLSSFEEYKHITSQETLRLMLAKQLLSELFLTHQHLINYMDLLFAFCKDGDPRKGLGKALSLEMGNPICTNVEDGEKYVAELLEQKQYSTELNVEENCLKQETMEISKAIVESLLESAIQLIEGISIVEIIEPTETEILPGKRDIQIEKLDRSESEDSDQLLLKDWKCVSTLSDRFNIVTKESTSTTLIVPKWIQSPFVSQTEMEINSKIIIVHWIPKEICLVLKRFDNFTKVLTTRLKLFSKDPEALQSIREELDSVYESLRDDKLDHEENTVLSHRLINHSFMRALLINISNFTTRHMSAIVNKVINQD